MSTAALRDLDSPDATRPLWVHGPHLDTPTQDERRRNRALSLADAKEFTRACALVAEDDPAMRRLLVEALRDAGYRVVEVANGKQLARCLEDERGTACPRPDLVISDIRMPGHSGLEVLAALRQSDWMMPFILITAFADDATREEAQRLGAALVMDKPFDVDDLVHVANNIVPAKL